MGVLAQRFVTLLALTVSAHAMVPWQAGTLRTMPIHGARAARSASPPSAAAPAEHEVTKKASSGSPVSSSAVTSIDVTAELFSMKSQDASQDAILSSQAAAIASYSAEMATHTNGANASVATADGWDTTNPIFDVRTGDFTQSIMWYGNWTLANREMIQKSSRGELREFIFQHLGGNYVECGVEQPTCGCNLDRMGILDHIQKHVKDKETAAHVAKVLLAVDEAFKVDCALIHGARTGTNEVGLLMEKMTETFWPQPDKKALSHCQAIDALIDSFVTVAIILAAGLLLDAAGTLFVAASFNGVIGKMAGARGANLRASLRQQRSLARLGITNPSIKGAFQAERDALGFAGTNQKVIDNLGKYAIGNSVGKWVSEYSGQRFEPVLEERRHCGLSIAQDQRLENMGCIGQLLQQNLEVMPSMVSMARAQLINGTGTVENGTYEDGVFSGLASRLLSLFPNVTAYENIRNRNVQESQVVDMIREHLKARLTQRIWNDQQCFMQCAKNESPGECIYKDRHGNVTALKERPEAWCSDDGKAMCQAVCWQGGMDPGLVPLYGVEKLEDKPWSIKRKDMYKVSWQAYNQNATAAYHIVESGGLVGWGDGERVHNNESLPLLAVAWAPKGIIQDVRPHKLKKHEAGKELICTSGDRWGNNSKAFFAAGHWALSKDHTYLASRCRNNIKGQVAKGHHPDHHPGLFYSRMSRVLAYAAYPNATLIKLGGPYYKTGDLENALEWIEYVDTDVPKLREKGLDEVDIECRITKEICKHHKGDTDNRFRRHIHHGEKLELDRNDDHNHDEGFGKTLEDTQNGCGKWSKEYSNC